MKNKVIGLSVAFTLATLMVGLCQRDDRTASCTARSHADGSLHYSQSASDD